MAERSKLEFVTVKHQLEIDLCDLFLNPENVNAQRDNLKERLQQLKVLGFLINKLI